MLNKKLPASSVRHSPLSRTGGNSEAQMSEQAQLPPWRQAFSLAENVRFTRTPDCELMRKRAEIDPDYAARLALRAAQKKQQKTTQQEKEIMSKAAAPQIDPIDRISLLSAADKVQLSPTSLISDFAFFEGGAFLVPSLSDNDKNEPAMTEGDGVSHGSIIDLFRTLECRFPGSPAPDSSALCLPSVSHSLKGSASFSKPYNMASAVSLNIGNLTPKKPESTQTGHNQPECFPETGNQFSDKSCGKNKELEHGSDLKIATYALERLPEPNKGKTAQGREEEDIDVMARSAIETESITVDSVEDEFSETMPDSLFDESPDLAEEAKNGDENISSDAPIVSDIPPIKTSVTITPRSENRLDPCVSLLRPAHLVEDYVFPPLDLLQMPVYKDGAIISQETLERSAGLLENVLEDFGIKGEIIHVRPGPVVTLYEFEPAPGVKSSRIIGLSDDIARSMSAISTRVAVIPGRNVIGIELPNEVRDTVFLRELVQSKSFCASDFKLALALGKNIGGEPIIAELAKMPHLLVAGTTGSGKSVAINTMILSLLYRLKPDQCRLIMVDPKMLELSIYDGIPHLLTPVVTDPKKAVTALKWAVREMEERYRKMAKLGVRNIDGFNERVTQAAKAGESITCTVQAGFDKETGELLYAQEAMDLTPLPYIVIIVDEMADLMMVAGKEIEGAIQRLAQMARAAGIHLIMATQRPSVDVITGTIKANFPTRISFQVTSRIDSRTILGEHGAETLLGQGDMLHMAGGGRIVRVHGAFVSDSEVEHIVAHLKEQGKPDYLATVTDSEEEGGEGLNTDNIAEIVSANGEDSEELYVQAVKVVMRDKKCSTSYIQRRLGVGYNKAASLVERMEHEGLVGQANHVGKREILNQ